MTHTAEVTMPSDREVRVARCFKASAERLFAAYTQPALLKRWLLGPPGWQMPECEVDLREGGAYRFLWRKDDGSAEFGSEGVYLEVSPPHRIVQTQRMFGALAGPMAEAARGAIEFRDAPGGSLMITTILSPSRETRDAALATGMTRGMEQSYARLETAVLEVTDVESLGFSVIASDSEAIQNSATAAIPKSGLLRFFRNDGRERQDVKAIQRFCSPHGEEQAQPASRTMSELVAVANEARRRDLQGRGAARCYAVTERSARICRRSTG